MAKGAATEKIMGDLHQKVAHVFLRILKTYEDAMNVRDLDEVVEGATVELLGDGPNPAMMGAITKFLKDNSIDFDNEEIQKLSDTEQRLNARKEKRIGLVQLGQLALVKTDDE